MNLLKTDLNQKISFNAFKEQVLQDYKIIVERRECAILGRREQNFEFLVMEKNLIK